MSGTQVRSVDVGSWRAAHEDARAQGFGRCEWITAYDRDGIVLVSHLVRANEVLVLTARLDGDYADSVTEVFPSAQFHEREVSQMFGVQFAGHPDPRPAFAIDLTAHPLRRNFPLLPRTQTAWPGAHEPDSAGRRRPTPVPGVNKEWET